MKKSKKLVLKKRMLRQLTGDALAGAAGGMTGNALCTQSACASGTCTGDVMGCGGDGTMQCTGASSLWCVTQMAGC